ncbi:glycosyltransferase family 2 protein [Flavobacterium nitrogenifigens]|uniref:Glycosyltransferase, GT2 family n=1 Tax=Flavobacterium nitrogenifigens TaxID=1617283 RepID=A0A521AJU6_9FLAO|nr:glycosyltransferase [Flavobacterium nitrogenifigens]KAF2331607.1 glycosyltransferase family 2 protein [Flavobacterium nitrogenifigens]SMO35041.1 Glycosyltransferase, GT2 family [Flavobacterium nitrogenifigens]
MKNKLDNFFKESDIEILISTMNQNSLDFLVPMFPYSHFSSFSILIINQTQKEKILTSDYFNVRVINSFEKGLAKSRNLALENALGKILVIADDDVVYKEGFAIKIIDVYNKFPKAAVINFEAENLDGSLIKKYPSDSKANLNIFDVLNSSSIEMTLNKKIINESKVSFDENFGLGAVFEMGEEAIFLSDLKAKQKQLVFEPQIIVIHKNQTSSEKKSIDDKYYIQGALFSRIFKKKYLFWLYVKLFFDLKQNNIKFKNVKRLVAIAKKGHIKFEQIQHENE